MPITTLPPGPDSFPLTMRHMLTAMLLPFAGWLGAIQAVTDRTSSIENMARLPASPGSSAPSRC